MRDHKGWFLKGNYVLSKGQDMWEVTTSYVFEIYLSLYLLFIYVNWFIKFLFIDMWHLFTLPVMDILIIPNLYLHL